MAFNLYRSYSSRSYTSIYYNYLNERCRNPNIDCIWLKCIKDNDIDMLSWLDENKKEEFNYKYIYKASGLGRLDIVKKFYRPDEYSILKEWAILNGQVEVVEWLNKRN
jgi:hypothetical protein